MKELLTQFEKMTLALAKDGAVIKQDNTPEQAFLAYKIAKESYIKEVAEKWRDQIDPRVYNTLMNYEVNIDD